MLLCYLSACYRMKLYGLYSWFIIIIINYIFFFFFFFFIILVNDPQFVCISYIAEQVTDVIHLALY